MDEEKVPLDRSPTEFNIYEKFKEITDNNPKNNMYSLNNFNNDILCENDDQNGVSKIYRALV